MKEIAVSFAVVTLIYILYFASEVVDRLDNIILLLSK